MKTLIIAGTHKTNAYTIDNTTTYKVEYNVTLFGQTKERPLMECIGFINEELTGFDDLQRVARAKYCQYFDTDLNNIISMEVLNAKI